MIRKEGTVWGDNPEVPRNLYILSFSLLCFVLSLSVI